MKIEGIGALVVGGASGLGAATVELLKERGANVAVADLKPPEDGGDTPFYETDVQDEEKVKAAVEGAVEALGELRFCVNCAGVGWAERTIGREGPANPMPFEITLGVNLIGMYRVLRHAAWAMSQNEPDEGGERGAFVNAWERSPLLVIFSGPGERTRGPEWLCRRGAIERAAEDRR